MRGSCKCSCRHTTPLQVCGCSGSLLSHPLLSHPQTHPVGVRTSYHTPWFITSPFGPLQATPYHPGYTRYHTSHRIPHPVIVFLNSKMLPPGGVILCQLRYERGGIPFFFTSSARQGVLQQHCKYDAILLRLPSFTTPLRDHSPLSDGT